MQARILVLRRSAEIDDTYCYETLERSTATSSSREVSPRTNLPLFTASHSSM
jgi:hypothetical protein